MEKKCIVCEMYKIQGLEQLKLVEDTAGNLLCEHHYGTYSPSEVLQIVIYKSTDASINDPD